MYSTLLYIGILSHKIDNRNISHAEFGNQYIDALIEGIEEVAFREEVETKIYEGYSPHELTIMIITRARELFGQTLTIA
jgi:hypothetical protein